MHNVLFFQFFFSLEFSFLWVLMELFFSLRSYYIGICGIYFFNHQIIFLVFIFCFLGNYSNKGRLGFGSNPLSKNLQQKRVWTPVSMKQTNKRPNLIRLWHLPLPAMSFTEAVKLQLPLLLHHLLHIHGRVPLKNDPKNAWCFVYFPLPSGFGSYMSTRRWSYSKASSSASGTR